MEKTRSQGDRITAQIRERIQDTFSPNVIQQETEYSGTYALNGRNWLFSDRYDDPVLMSATEGVGPKLEIASDSDDYERIGNDLVAKAVNKIMSRGARPLFFLDYLSGGNLHKTKVLEIVEGIVQECKEAGCSLIGGDVSEMPEVYSGNQHELVGFCVGVAERRRMIKGEKITSGDAIIGFPSPGLYTNEYSFAKQTLIDQEKLSLDDSPSPVESSLRDHLLKPTQNFGRALRALFNHYQGRMPIKGIVNMNGGGFFENFSDVLPRSCTAHLDSERWEIPPLFRLLKKRLDSDSHRMFQQFHMGIGMMLVCDPYFASAMIRKVQTWVPDATIIGSVQEGENTIQISHHSDQNTK